MVGVVQAVGIDEMRFAHAELGAVAFISAAKASTEPSMLSAIITATSLGDFTISIFSALSSVTSVPGRKPIFEGGMHAPRAPTWSAAYRASAARRAPRCSAT